MNPARRAAPAMALAALALLLLAVPAVAQAAAQPRKFTHGNLPFWRSHRFNLNKQMSEEFHLQKGRINPLRWIVHDPHRGIGMWDGRQPGLCHVKNVWIKGWRPWRFGGLQIQANAWARGTDEYYNLFETKRPRRDASFEWYGYSTYTTGMVSSKRAVKYGYFEIEAMTMRTQLVNAWWFSSRVNGIWSEIDVFENSHVTKAESKWNMEMTVRSVPNAHVYNRPTQRIDPKHLISARPKDYVHPEPIARRPIVYGLLWTPTSIIWFINGKPFVAIANQYWKQPLFVRFDVETNFAWHGILPNVQELNRSPKHFEIKYFRVWSLEYTGAPGLNKWSATARTVDSTIVEMDDAMLGTSGTIAGHLRGVPPSVRYLDDDDKPNKLDGELVDADELDELRAEYYASRVRDVKTKTYGNVNQLPWDKHDPMTLVRVPYEGESFGEYIRAQNNMTWQDIINKYSKQMPPPKTWEGFLDRVADWFKHLFD